MTVDECAGQPAGVLTRRRFIERLGLVGGTTMILAGMEALGFGIGSANAAPPELPGTVTGKTVVILGAGLAGMTSAYELTKKGYTVTVLEARSFAGGRCQTGRAGVSLTELGGQTQTCDFDEGLYINHGPWRIPYHHRSTLHYTKEFGVPLELFVNDNDNSYVYFEKGTGPLAGKPVRKGQIAADARGNAAELLAKVINKGGLDLPMTTEDRDLFVAYLVNEGYLSPKDLAYAGTEGRGYEVRPGAGVDPGPGKPTVPYSMTDVLHSKTWAVLTSVANYEQQRTMFQPVGGMDQIAKGFEKKVGHLIQYSAVVEKIDQSDKGVAISYRDADGKPKLAKGDYCICTIPISVLKGIEMSVSAPFKAAMNNVAYAPVGKMGLQMKRRFWEEDHFIYGGHVHTDMRDIGSITLPSTGFQSQKGVILGYYNFGSEAAKVSAKSPADRAALAVAQGQKIFPEYADSYEKSFSVAWHRIAYNLGGWAEWSEAGRKEAYPVLCQPEGRIYLAGEHLSYIGGWQAGAIESAWQQIERLHKRVMA
jgi:monoamine oxidase